MNDDFEGQAGMNRCWLPRKVALNLKVDIVLRKNFPFPCLRIKIIHKQTLKPQRHEHTMAKMILKEFTAIFIPITISYWIAAKEILSKATWGVTTIALSAFFAKLILDIKKDDELMVGNKLNKDLDTAESSIIIHTNLSRAKKVQSYLNSAKNTINIILNTNKPETDLSLEFWTELLRKISKLEVRNQFNLNDGNLERALTQCNELNVRVTIIFLNMDHFLTKTLAAKNTPRPIETDIRATNHEFFNRILEWQSTTFIKLIFILNNNNSSNYTNTHYQLKTPHSYLIPFARAQMHQNHEEQQTTIIPAIISTTRGKLILGGTLTLLIFTIFYYFLKWHGEKPIP